MATRSTSERVADARRRLTADRNVWVATASPDGIPHLVPLSLAWLGETIVVATPTETPTARNAAATGRARAALDDADDVVSFDTDVTVLAVEDASDELRAGYVAAAGWDPADNTGAWAFLVMTPRRGHAWNSLAETDDRTIVRDGVWLA